MAQLIQPRENIQGGHLHRTFKNCLNDEGKDLAGYKVVVEDLLWLPVGLNMDCSYPGFPLLHEGGEVNWGPAY